MGWRVALLPSGIGVLIAGLLAILFLADRPADLGLAPLARKAPRRPPPAPAGNAVRAAFAMLAEASRQPAFWALFATFFICGLSTNGLIQTHFISFCSDFGMPAVDSASVLAMMGVFDFVGTIASGWLSDRYDCRWLLFWYYGLRGLSLLVAALLHLQHLRPVDLRHVLRPRLDRDRAADGAHLGEHLRAREGRRWSSAGCSWRHQLGAAVAAFGAGLSRSELSTYLPAFYVAGAACLLAALIALAAKSTRARRRCWRETPGAAAA